MSRKQKDLKDLVEKDFIEEPKSDNVRPGRDKLMERMKKVDPKQSEKYKQRTGE